MLAPTWKKINCQFIGKQTSSTTTFEISYDYKSWGSRKKSRKDSKMRTIYIIKKGKIT